MPHTYSEGVAFAFALLAPLAGVLSVALVVLLAVLAWSRAARWVVEQVAGVRRARMIARRLADPAPWDLPPTSPPSSTSTNRVL